MKKRLISMLLLATVLLSCWVVPAAAAYAPRYTGYADALYELGLFQGSGTLPSGKPDYRLDRTITRAESIVMLLRLLGESDEAAASAASTPFTDLEDHWAASYIAYAYDKGYTNGTSATTFSPNQAASGKMYLTYLLRALGYDDGAGDFSYNTAHETAAELGLCAEGAYGSGTFYRDDCVYTSYKALGTACKGGDQALIYRLTDAATAQAFLEAEEPGTSLDLVGTWTGVDSLDGDVVEMTISLQDQNSFFVVNVNAQQSQGTRACGAWDLTFRAEADGTYTASFVDNEGNGYGFTVTPQWNNGALQLVLDSRITTPYPSLNYFFPSPVTLTRESGGPA